MSVLTTVSIGLSTRETLATAGAASGASPNAKVIHNGFDLATTLDGTTTVPATKVSAKVYTGTNTLDLTAVAGVEGNQDCTGLKLQAMLVTNLATAGVLNVAQGAANPYLPFGIGNDVDIPAGGTMGWFFNDKLPDISATVKNILFTAAAGGDTYRVQMIFG